MSRRLVIRTEAEAELLEAFRWYEQQQAGLGEELLECVETTLAQIQDSPERYGAVQGEIRRALVRRFPYGVFYLVRRDAIVVLAVFHASRDPKRWRTRS